MKLGLKGKVLIGVMALGLLGTVGSALALTRTGASAAGNAGAFDQAIYLNWESGQSSISLSNVENLQPSVAQYRYLTVSPKSTKTVAGNVVLTFTLAKTTGDHHIKGLSVSVYKTASLLNDSTVVAGISALSADPVLQEGSLSGTSNIAVAAGANAHETTAYYAIVIEWTGANDSTNPSYTLSADVTISQEFDAA